MKINTALPVYLKYNNKNYQYQINISKTKINRHKSLIYNYYAGENPLNFAIKKIINNFIIVKYKEIP